MHCAQRGDELNLPLSRAAAALAALACMATLAGCGGSGGAPAAAVGGGSATSANSSNPGAFAESECMRAHGVPNFPDPTRGPGGVGLSVSTRPGSSTITVAGITFSGPAFKAAATLCKFGPGNRAQHRPSEAQKQGMLASAACMRKHGVPNFPDPTFGPRGFGVFIRPIAGVNRNSPAFMAANQACQNVGTPLPGGG